MIGGAVALGLIALLLGAAGPPREAAGLVRWRVGRRHRSVDGAELADALDVCMLAAGAGLDAVDTLELVATHGPPAVARHLGPMVDALRVGRPLAEVVRAEDGTENDHGDAVAVLLDALGDAHRHGLPVIDRLRVVADDLRAVGRRREQAAARRLGVRVLLPVVVCLLPAFALLTVVPVVADALTR